MSIVKVDRHGRVTLGPELRGWKVDVMRTSSVSFLITPEDFLSEGFDRTLDGQGRTTVNLKWAGELVRIEKISPCAYLIRLQVLTDAPLSKAEYWAAEEKEARRTLDDPRCDRAIWEQSIL